MEAPQHAQAVLGLPLYKLQLVRLRPTRTMLRWLVPLLAMVPGALAVAVAHNFHFTLATNSLVVLIIVALIVWWDINKVYHPMAGLAVTSTLRLLAEAVVIMDNDQRTQLKISNLPIIIDYYGYQDEPIGRNSLDSYHNFIALGQ